MNPLDWSLIAGSPPVILLVSVLPEFAWPAAGPDVPRPLIVMAVGGVIALRTWLIENVLAIVSRPADAHHRALIFGGPGGCGVFARVHPIVVLARTLLAATPGFSWAARMTACAPRGSGPCTLGAT